MTPQEQLDAGQITPSQYYAMMTAPAPNMTPNPGASPAAAAVQAPPAATPTAALPSPGAAPGAPIPPPPGVTPDVWAKLSPGAQAVAAARIAQQGHPFAPAPGAAPGGEPPPVRPGNFDETGGGLRSSGPAGVNVPAPGQKRNLAVAGGASGGPTGVTEGQGQAGDPLASILRPQAGAGQAHRVGFSDADKNMLGSLNEQGQIAQTDAARQADAVKKIADTFAGQNDALAADSQKGLLDYQDRQKTLEAHRQQIDADSRAAQGRIEAHMADLQATGVDPNRYFQSQSTGQKILGALAVGFGALGAHALGPNGHDSTNTALDIMNNAIARDVDAQKANLQKSLSVLGSRMNLNAQNWDQQKAMLESERESIQSGYAVAQSEVAKRAAAFKDNAEIQTKALAMQAGLKAAADEKVGQINQQIYGIQKGAERVVGGGTGNDIAKMIRERAIKIRDDAAGHGKDISPEEAHRQAAIDLYGTDVAPGTARASYAAEPKNGAGKPMSARLARRMAELDAQDQNAQELDKLMASGSSLSMADRNRAAALAETLRNAGHKSVPESPIQTFSNTTAHRAGLDEVRKDIQREKDSLQRYGTGAPDETPDDNPAGLQKEGD